MAISVFGYIAATDPTTEPADIDFKYFWYDPFDMPEYAPYGQPVRCPDGANLYVSQPWFALQFIGQLYYTSPAGVVGSGHTTVEWYTEWYKALNTTNGLMWIRRWNVENDNIIKHVAKPEYVNYSGKINGVGLLNFAIVFRGQDAATSGAGGDYNGGTVFPPVVDATSSANPFIGGWGHGGFGRGPWGSGQQY